MLELQKIRIAEIRIIEDFCWEIFKGPENFVRLNSNEFELDRVNCIFLPIKKRLLPFCSSSNRISILEVCSNFLPMDSKFLIKN